MKYINDLAYSNQIIQAKQSAKDKRRKNKYRQTRLLTHDDILNETLGIEPDDISEELPTVEAKVERRKGEDRRKEQQNRGRYVESRLQKSRRYQKKLSVII